MGGQSDSRAAGMRRRSSCQQSTLLAVDTYLRALPPSVHTLKQQVLRDVYLTSQDGQERTASSITGPRLSVFTRNMKVQGGMSDSAHTKGQAPGTKTMAAASIRAAMKVASLNGSSATPLVDGEQAAQYCICTLWAGCLFTYQKARAPDPCLPCHAINP